MKSVAPGSFTDHVIPLVTAVPSTSLTSAVHGMLAPAVTFLSDGAVTFTDSIAAV